MTPLFLTIVNMSISAGWLVLAVLLLRLLLKRAPKWISVLLWGIVAIRLICPFSIESVWSMIPSAQTIDPEVGLHAPVIDTGVPMIDEVVNPIIGESTIQLQPEKEVNLFQWMMPYLAGIWLIGMAVLLGYTGISYLRVRKKIGTAVLLRDRIFQSENVVSPFVLGMIRPKIYLPFQMNEQDLEHVVAHEQAHIRRKDHWWKPFGFLVLTLHWFNPLMWVGYVLLCRDIELACDEKVVKELDGEQKADYSQALLNCSVNRRTIAACPLAFGEMGVKNRVKSVLRYKKPAFWVILAALLASIVVAICFLTNPKTTLEDDLAIFIDMQISEHHYSEVDTDDHFVAISQKVLEVDESFDKTTVYLWVLYNEYALENGEIKNVAGAHTPTVITVRHAEGEQYELLEYWTPRDGSFYAEDIREKFPWYLHGKALDSQRYIKEQMAFCDQAAEEYYANVANAGEADTTLVNTFESTLSFANWTDESEIYLKSLNIDKLDQNSIRHLPIYKFDTLEELEGFKKTFGGILTMDMGYDEVPSFQEATKKYNEAFFEENSLVLVYVSADNCTHRFGVKNVGYNENSFYVHVAETTGAESVDDAMAGWFLTVAISDKQIKNCKEFDADLNNATEPVSPKLSVQALKKIYPQFFDLSTDGGLIVYVWQMAEDRYSCYLADRAQEAIADNSFAFKNSATIAEMRVILSAYEIDREDITIQPVINPLSSFYYEINDRYRAKIKALFWDEPNGDSNFKTIPQLKVVCDGAETRAVMGTSSWTFDSGNKNMQSINADSSHPLAMLDYMMPLALKGDFSDKKPHVAKLYFELPPDSFKVNSWRLNDQGEGKAVNTAVEGKSIQLNADVYEIVATWNRAKYYGTVRYSFCVVDTSDPTLNNKYHSNLYTDWEIDGAIEAAKTYFNTEFKGCTLKKITYLGDSRLKDYKEFAERNGADEVLVLTSDFYVASKGASGALNADSTYQDFKWIMIRNKGEPWVHADHGYP